MLPMKMNLKDQKLGSTKCTHYTITFVSIWTFKLLVPSNQYFIQTFNYWYGMVCIHPNVQVLLFVDFTGETFPCLFFLM